ncbi:hypothetical protein PVAP13_6KG014850 [Panicum virgatum]|uniref:Uncharacterized protein n=1 Tax=Panicum virgatum TaxID=38727 RepID=A0A8T0R850_PANVG|nr:hypothetical protein PVAP13_6KG014850 [Panicum virgatum]
MASPTGPRSGTCSTRGRRSAGAAAAASCPRHRRHSTGGSRTAAPCPSAYPSASSRTSSGGPCTCRCGKREEAQGEGERRDGRHGDGHDLVAAVPPRARVASGVPGQGARAGAGDDVHPPRRLPGARAWYTAGLHGQHRDARRGQVHGRRRRGQGAGLVGVAPEPRCGGVRRGDGEGLARAVAAGAQVRVRGAARGGRRHGRGDRELAAVRRVRQRLRVGPAGGRAQRRREEDGREGDGVRGARRRGQHGAGGVPVGQGAGPAGSSPTRSSWRPSRAPAPRRDPPSGCNVA